MSNKINIRSIENFSLVNLNTTSNQFKEFTTEKNFNKDHFFYFDLSIIPSAINNQANSTPSFSPSKPSGLFAQIKALESKKIASL